MTDDSPPFLQAPALSIAAHAGQFAAAPPRRLAAPGRRPLPDGAGTGAGFAACREMERWMSDETAGVLDRPDAAPSGMSDGVLALAVCREPVLRDGFEATTAELARVMRQDGTAVLLAALRHNPFARPGGKRRLTGLGSHAGPASFRIPQPLSCNDIDSLRAQFGGVEVRVFDLLTPALARLEAALLALHPALGRGAAPVFRHLWPLLRAADRRLLAWRPLRRHAAHAVVVLKWPRRHDRT